MYLASSSGTNDGYRALISEGEEPNVSGNGPLQSSMPVSRYDLPDCVQQRNL